MFCPDTCPVPLDFPRDPSLISSGTGLEGIMGEDKAEERDIGYLFALATARIEDAHEIAVAGQNPRLTPSEQRTLRQQLLTALEGCRLVTEQIDP